MRKLIFVAMFALGGFGCAHEMHQAKADAYHREAKSDAKHLHLGDAMHEEHNSNVEQRKADTSRF